MGKTRIGLIRVLTKPIEYFSRMDLYLEELWPGISIESEIIPDQPEGVFNESSFRIAEPKVFQACLRLEKMGFDGVVINCAMDPGLEDASRECKIPVFGAGNSAACLARATNRPVGILGLVEEVPAGIQKILGEMVASSVSPKGVCNVLDLWTEEGRKATVEASEKLIAQGARSILLACTGMTPLGLAHELRGRSGVPVFDPLISALTLLSIVLRSDIEQKTLLFREKSKLL